VTTVWLDCRAGVSGDMLLGALAELGVLDDLPDLVDSLDIGATVRFEPVTRAGLAATAARVDAGTPQPSRRLDDLLALVARAPVPNDVGATAGRVLARIAEAEARVHGTTPDHVHLHEVGAVDTVVDVVGGALGLSRLGAVDVTTSRVAVGGGEIDTAHGRLPVPGPAVLELARGTHLQLLGGGEVELATPTGVALLAELTSATTDLPAMHVTSVGTGAGSRERPDQPNVLRLIVGTPTGPSARSDWVVLEANVDDLDPRLWPTAIDALLAAGAVDAWLTPIVMKKGRPAHTVAALCAGTQADTVRAAMFTHTSTIGVRETAVAKEALERDWTQVEVDGQPIRIKLARRDGAVVNATPEWDDVAAAAAATQRPAKEVLAAAIAAGEALR
jgi:uncharacterized protein (TIGR00299 family) protein